MSFLRHRRSFRPIWQEQTGSRLGAHSRLSSARMSRNRLFLGGSVSTGAHFRFIGCAQNAVQWSCRSSYLKRTVNSVLFACLSRGVHPRLPLTTLITSESVTIVDDRPATTDRPTILNATIPVTAVCELNEHEMSSAAAEEYG